MEINADGHYLGQEVISKGAKISNLLSTATPPVDLFSLLPMGHDGNVKRENLSLVADSDILPNDKIQIKVPKDRFNAPYGYGSYRSYANMLRYFARDPELDFQEFPPNDTISTLNRSGRDIEKICEDHKEYNGLMIIMSQFAKEHPYQLFPNILPFKKFNSTVSYKLRFDKNVNLTTYLLTTLLIAFHQLYEMYEWFYPTEDDALAAIITIHLQTLVHPVYWNYYGLYLPYSPIILGLSIKGALPRTSVDGWKIFKDALKRWLGREVGFQALTILGTIIELGEAIRRTDDSPDIPRLLEPMQIQGYAQVEKTDTRIYISNLVSHYPKLFLAQLFSNLRKSEFPYMKIFFNSPSKLEIELISDYPIHKENDHYWLLVSETLISVSSLN
jgi:hypothetical protein